MLKGVLRAVWEFGSYLFVSQRRARRGVTSTGKPLSARLKTWRQNHQAHGQKDLQSTLEPRGNGRKEIIFRYERI